MISVAIRPPATLRRVVLTADSLLLRVLLPPVLPSSRLAPGSIPLAIAAEISNVPAASMVIERWLSCAIICNLGGRLDATQVEHGIHVEIISPPVFVGHGFGKHRVPRPARVEVGLDSNSFISLMVPLGVSANAVEMFVPHFDVGHVDEKPSLMSVLAVEAPHQLSIVVEELRVNSPKKQERGPQDSE